MVEQSSSYLQTNSHTTNYVSNKLKVQYMNGKISYPLGTHIPIYPHNLLQVVLGATIKISTFYKRHKSKGRTPSVSICKATIKSTFYEYYVRQLTLIKYLWSSYSPQHQATPANLTAAITQASRFVHTCSKMRHLDPNFLS
jgi:hypothetical protein